MLTELEKDRLCLLPIDPHMFSEDEWNDFQRRFARALKAQEVMFLLQELPPIATPSNNERMS